MSSKHQSRFEKWQRLCPVATRSLSQLVATRLAPILEQSGFTRVDVSLCDSTQLVPGSALEFERQLGDSIDSVMFNFDKYHAPRFQVHMSRRASDPPHAFRWAGNLVSRPSQYLHFWGKPWWFPLRAWPDRAVESTIDSVERILPAGIYFLSTGERGSNISKAVAQSGAA